MSEPLNTGAPMPDAGQKRWWKIISPYRRRPLHAILTGRTFHAEWTHYVPPTLPCTRDEHCLWCKARIGNRFNGYIDCVQCLDGCPYVLGLTFGACKQLLPALKERGTLRGLRVELTRRYDAPNAPVVVTIKSDYSATNLPAGFNVEDSLCRMWGINREFHARGCRRLDDVEREGPGAGALLVDDFLKRYGQMNTNRMTEGL